MTINDSVIGRVSNLEKVKYQIDKFILQHNPRAPKLGEYFVTIGTKFGIRPEYAAAQSIFETGYYRFGGQVDASWHNPAGLKCNNQFLRFSNWEQGIHAFYERLNCYVRAYDTTGEGGKYDPCYGHWRYDYIKTEKKQKPDTPIGIATLWQTGSPQVYANNVVRIANEIMAIPYYGTPGGEVPGGEIPSKKEEYGIIIPMVIIGIGILGATIIYYMARK